MKNRKFLIFFQKKCRFCVFETQKQHVVTRFLRKVFITDRYGFLRIGTEKIGILFSVGIRTYPYSSVLWDVAVGV